MKILRWIRNLLDSRVARREIPLSGRWGWELARLDPRLSRELLEDWERATQRLQATLNEALERGDSGDED